MRTLPLLLFLMGLTAPVAPAAGTNTVLVKVYGWPLQGILTADSDLRGVGTLWFGEEADAPRSSVYRNGTGPWIEVTATNRVLAYSREGDPPAPVLRVDQAVDPEWTRVLLVVQANQVSSNQLLQTWAFPLDEARLPVGHVRFHNDTPTDLQLEIFGMEQHIASGEGATVAIPSEPGELQSRYRVFTVDEGSRRRQTATGVVHPDPARATLLLLTPRGTRRVSVLTLYSGTQEPSP